MNCLGPGGGRLARAGPSRPDARFDSRVTSASPRMIRRSTDGRDARRRRRDGRTGCKTAGTNRTTVGLRACVVPAGAWCAPAGGVRERNDRSDRWTGTTKRTHVPTYESPNRQRAYVSIGGRTDGDGDGATDGTEAACVLFVPFRRSPPPPGTTGQQENLTGLAGPTVNCRAH